MKNDKKTGLPEAPEGMYWRVDFSGRGEHAYIYLMRDGMRTSYPALDLESCDWAGIYGGGLFRIRLLTKDKVRPRHIRHAAREVLRARAKFAQVGSASSVVAEKYAGDYPPKKLS